MKNKILAVILLGACFTACNNDSTDFDDFDYSTVYFSYQSPIRTITLGEDDQFDTSLDNEHKCKIMATMGGVRKNKKKVFVDVVVDNSLCDDLKFNKADGADVIAMPSEYYKLSQDMQIIIPKGEHKGGMEVQLTDAFFADPRAVENTFVIPLRITNAENVDSILVGRSSLENPDRRVAADWIAAPKDYILYAVKYINTWHGSYLRRGIDVVKGNGGNTALDDKIVYHAAHVEKDEVCKLVTKSLKETILSLNTKNKKGESLPFDLKLTFDDKGNCVVSAAGDNGYTVSGNGEYVEKGDMWGNEKRNVLHLDYSVNFVDATHSFSDTLVVRDRGVVMETFDLVVVK